ncbi:MAG: valine--tRNA ligase, partial [Clostridia bacterium]|nr:valine--tRNA ligase [Clostridia bacterium]
DNLSRAVKETFVRYYEKGWIYHGARIINQCPGCKTAISDAEVEYETEDGFFWHIRYPEENGGEGVVVATTRPETLLGDMAVAVHPSDKRYASLVGKRLVLPLTGRTIPVVADEYVDKSFGTGAVKITPAHDPNDFEVGLRHGLEVMRVMDDTGHMNELAGKYEGMDRYEARKAMVADLEALGLLVKVEPHTHNVGHCHRCHSAIEPIVSKQWFVKMKELAQPAIDVVKSKELRYLPKRFEKNYLYWMENIRDWCISRQLWWGHRIPVYYCDDCGGEFVSREDMKVCPKCGKGVRQDEDVLDTWFSSALWPFSTLGWPDKTPDLEYFYPTDVLVTAYDIITFWVARMIYSGIEFMGEKPFDTVLIHGLVRDELGRKLSKSLGNGIDPLEIIDKVGADVLRISLVSGVSAGGDIKYSDKKQEGYRNFMNKIWNASRFVLMNAEGVEVLPIEKVKLTLADKWIITRLNSAIADVTKYMERYEVGLAANRIYDFVWGEFCDWYVELSKVALYSADEKKRQATLSVLVRVLRDVLKLAHPVIPFITAEIYDNLPEIARDADDVMISAYPSVKDLKNRKADAVKMDAVMDAIRRVRALRAEMGVKPSKRTSIYIKPSDVIGKSIKDAGEYLVKLASGADFAVVTEKQENCATVVTALGEIYLPLGELVDYDKEIERLGGELKTAQDELNRAQGKLSNEKFVSKAPKALVDAEKAKVDKYTDRIAVLESKIADMKSASGK